MHEKFKYCNSVTRYSRLNTKEVNIGNVPMGGKNPIRIQSMTTTPTMDTNATIEQSIRMINAGCEYVRITAPSKTEAENLLNIKKGLSQRGFNVPIVADIHFTPNAAEIAARIVEKVRVNPGNYVDKKKFEHIEYSDKDYEAELERIYRKFSPLVKICKEHGTAMRIGTNHGSLSDRIMSRYGDTPLGMVESALEFVRICEDLKFYEIVLSMKASNPQIMIQAYRLLVNKMSERGSCYPIHLGVTEAGDGEDGRIKSSAGIGTLLEDGIGDTVRVSLTEEPEAEVPVAITLVKRYNDRIHHKPIPATQSVSVSPFEYNKRKTNQTLNIGDKNVPVIVADFSIPQLTVNRQDLQSIGYTYSAKLDKWSLNDTACDYIYLAGNSISFELPGTLKIIYNYSKWLQENEKQQQFNDLSSQKENQTLKHNARSYPLMSSTEYLLNSIKSKELNFVLIELNELTTELLTTLRNDNTVVLCLNTNNLHGMPEQRAAICKLADHKIESSVIIKRDYRNLTQDEFLLYSSTDFGGLFLTGLGDGMWISCNNTDHGTINKTAFGILQACRLRVSKTEYISCPSCGRTLFDLQETTAKIRSRTNHLKGVKIGIMGCIVNGPGEMADADFGYVGTGSGKITLYKGKEIVCRNVPAENAVDDLIELIKEHGMWVEPPVNEAIKTVSTN